MDSPERQAIWDETNLIISVTNDILSLKKEIKQGCINTIILLATASGKSVQDSIIEAVDVLRKSKARFDIAAESLVAIHGNAENVVSQIRAFIEVCRSNRVGNLVWR